MEKKLHKEENYFLADWLEGKISDSQLKNIVPEQEYLEYQKLKKSFDILNELNTPLDSTLKTIKQKINSDNKTKIIPLYIKWTIGIVASLILFLGIYNNFSTNKTLYKTNFGEQRTIVLLDGSKVILNAKSTIEYNTKTWKNKRELLLNGEAYFKVAKGNTFTVKTKNGNITVLGTQFNVSSKDDFFSVVCYEGKVQVISKSKTKHILTQGNAVTSLNKIEETWSLSKAYPDWISGESTFKNTPLKYVIKELENQFNIIIVKNNIDDSIKFTGSFNNKKLNIALATVFKPMRIAYKIEPNKKTITLHKTKKE